MTPAFSSRALSVAVEASSRLNEKTSADGLAVTWVSTSILPFEGERIGKSWAAKGKWPVTPGACKSQYAFTRASYPDLQALAKEINAHGQAGYRAMVMGRLRPGLDLTKLHPRNGETFIDALLWFMIFDIDGFKPERGDLSRPKEFNDARVLKAIRELLPQALAVVEVLLLASASTGFARDSNGDPADGCARFRPVFLLDRPLTLAQQKMIAEALGRLPGFAKPNGKGSAIDLQIYSRAHFVFTARPALPADMKDPIDKPALWCIGEPRVNVGELIAQLKLKGRIEALGAPQAAGNGVETGSDQAPLKDAQGATREAQPASSD
jgi:hypothetical protein